MGNRGRVDRPAPPARLADAGQEKEAGGREEVRAAGARDEAAAVRQALGAHRVVHGEVPVRREPCAPRERNGSSSRQCPPGRARPRRHVMRRAAQAPRGNHTPNITVLHFGTGRSIRLPVYRVCGQCRSRGKGGEGGSILAVCDAGSAGSNRGVATPGSRSTCGLE